MGCGMSTSTRRRDCTHYYHGVAPPAIPAVIVHSQNSSRVAQSFSFLSERSDITDFESNAFKDDATSSRRTRSENSRTTRRTNQKKGTHLARLDRLMNFGDFRLLMVDELANKSQEFKWDQESPQAPYGVIGRYQPPRSSASRSSACVGVPESRSLRGSALASIGGHPRRVKFVLLSQNDRLIFSCANDSLSVSVHHMDLGCEVGRLVGHDDAVLGGDVSVDGRQIATASRDTTVIVWDTTTRKMRLSLPHPKVVFCCRFDPVHSNIATACQDGVCRIWSLTSGREIHNFTGHKGIVLAVAYSTDGSHILSGGSEKQVFIWSPLRSAVESFNQHTSGILSVYTKQGPHGDIVVSADENTVYIWDLSSRTSLRALDVVQLTTESACIPRRYPVTTQRACSAFFSDASSTMKRVYWTCACFAPSPFGGYVMVSTSTNTVLFICFEKSHDGGRQMKRVEAAPLQARPRVHNPPVEDDLGVPFRSTVGAAASGVDGLAALGDHYGNVYLLSLR